MIRCYLANVINFAHAVKYTIVCVCVCFTAFVTSAPAVGRHAAMEDVVPITINPSGDNTQILFMYTTDYSTAVTRILRELKRGD